MVYEPYNLIISDITLNYLQGYNTETGVFLSLFLNHYLPLTVTNVTIDSPTNLMDEPLINAFIDRLDLGTTLD